MPTYFKVEAASFEFAVLLAECTRLTKAMDAAIAATRTAARALLDGVLRPHLGTVEARKQARASRHAHYQHVQGTIRSARFNNKIHKIKYITNKQKS